MSFSLYCLHWKHQVSVISSNLGLKEFIEALKHSHNEDDSEHHENSKRPIVD